MGLAVITGPIICVIRLMLGERRRHNRGHGRKLKGVASGSSSTQPSPYAQMYTKEQVDAMFAIYNQQLVRMAETLRNANILVPLFNQNQEGNNEDDSEDEDEENDD